MSNRDRTHPTDRAIADEIRTAAEALAKLMGQAVEEGLDPDVAFERVSVDVTSMADRGPRRFTTGFVAHVTVSRPIS